MIGRKKPAPKPRPLLASASMISQGQLRTLPNGRDWQSMSWLYYDMVVELRFAATWVSSALSRCRLYVGESDPDGSGEPTPTKDPRAQAALAQFFGGPAGQADMLARCGLHLFIPGETFLVGTDIPGRLERLWHVASTEELKINSATGVSMFLPDSTEQVELDLENSMIIRVWRPRGRRAYEADSPVRAALPICQELMDLDAHVHACVESRLAGAGIFEIPDDAVLPTPPSGEHESDLPLHEDPDMATLIDAMVTPIGNRASASAVVPIIMRVPASAAGKARHITFSTPLTKDIQGLRDAATRRLAVGLDVPGEILTGLGDVNHWGAWAVEESAIKLHIEPLLQTLCTAITQHYLRTALGAMQVANPEKFQIWYDVSELAQRPNRGPEAIQLYQAGLIGPSPVLQEHGFGTADLATPEERREIILTQLALAGVDPTVVAPYLKALGIEITPPPTPATPTPGQTALPTGPAVPALPPSARRALPATPGAPGLPTSPAAAQELILEFAVLRALEKAGHRLRTWAGRSVRGAVQSMPAWEIHTVVPAETFDADRLLEGAYDLLDLTLPDQPCLKLAVDGYVRALLYAGKPYDRRYLAAALRQAGCVEVEGG